VSAPTPTSTSRSRLSVRRLVLLGLGLSVLLAVVVSSFAATSPDGLEHVAHQLGFSSSATAHQTADSPLADYGTRGISHGGLSTAVAGLIGVGVVGVLAFGLMYLLRSRGPKRP
jgi:cobalt/nickel transport protein